VSKAPTGTVSIVFTDIQGSTALWERFGDEFAPALQLHHQTIRACITANEGYEVKTEGDAFMVAFSSAASALRFCAQAQLALHRAAWPEALLEDRSPIAAALSTADGAFRGVRVRMGVHTGKPTPTPDPQTGRTDYLGRMVNKAARIARAGHGGQILVSARAFERAGVSADDKDMVFRGLGEHTLRDIVGRERLRELQPSPLQARSFPPIKTLLGRQSNILPATHRFVGRADELTALNEHLRAGARLLSICGPTGVGKRRIALELAAQQLELSPGGTWCADLSDCQDGYGLYSAVGRTLGVALTQPDPVAQIGNALLGRGRIILVMTNLQTVSNEVSQAIESWLRRAPDARLLVTSTEPLAHTEAQILPLDPLPEVGASTLLRSKVGPGVADIGDALRMAQGIPLCLEILAPLVAEIPQQTGPTSQLPPAAQALQRSISAAVGALSPIERNALGCLSVFSGGFTDQAATAVCAESVYSCLQQRGLVVELCEDRRVVPVAISEWIAIHKPELLLTAEAVHGTWASELAEQAIATQDMQVLGAERDNLRIASQRGSDRGDVLTAGRTALGLIHSLHWHGPPLAALAVATRALSLPNLPPRMEAELLRCRALSQHFQGELQAAEDDLQAAALLAKTIDDPSVAAQVYLEQGRQHDASGAIELAMAAFQSSLDAFHASEDPAGEGRAIAAMGNLAAKRGELPPAERLYMAALAQHRRVGDPQAEGAALSNLAVLTTIDGRPAEARELFRDALAIHRAQGDRRGEAVVLGNLGDLYIQTLEWDIARVHLNSALRIARMIGNRHIEGCFLGSLGEVEARCGHLPQARSYMARAERLLHEVGDTYELIKLICRRGQVELLGQYPDRAARCLAQAEALVSAMSTGPDTKPHQAIEELKQQLQDLGQN
jgi:class 3 adenylate cyclase/tetratricopeptide (TPR) repeat protein